MLVSWQGSSFNMSWIEPFIFFSVFSVIIVAGFVAYAKALEFFSKFRGLIRIPIVISVYLIFGVFLMVPIFTPFLLFDEWRLEFNESMFYMVYLMVLYFLSMFPGLFVFKVKYLNRLKRLGYFANK